MSLLLLAGAFDLGASVDGSVRAGVTHEAGLEPSGEDQIPLGRLEAEARTGGPAQSASSGDDQPPRFALAASPHDWRRSARLAEIVDEAGGDLRRVGAPSTGHPVRAPPA